ncbi:MAG: metal/formaldehyde-sensitive transcriptional repressor [bacterium]|jgi:DNA-binding FrmR family transcriptional regulator|nr:metal/formaldehyde-sensitive transcriptional repressor [Nitratifractor sp.]
MYQCDVENKKLLNRINRISGQVNALKKRLEDEVECNEAKDPYEVIRQLSAIKGAVNGMMNSYIEHFAKGHLVKEIREAKEESSAMAQMDSLVDIMKSFSK